MTQAKVSASAGETPADPPFRHIAACLDGSELGERVIPHALAVAQALGSAVTFLRVLEGRRMNDSPPDPIEWDLRRREARGYLERLAAERSEAAVSVEVELIEGHAAAQICLWARHHGVDLTVLCSHGISGHTEWSLSSTARKLVERAPGSLLLVPAAARLPVDIARYRRMLVPLDGSARAESVIPLAVRLAGASNGELVLAHMVPIAELTEIGLPDAEDLELRERLVRRNERVANEYLDRLRARLGESGLTLRTMVLRSSDVRARLARLIADEMVDLVVLSAHGQGGRCDAPCGSVAAYLVAHSAAPLLIVRPRNAHAATRPHVESETGARLPSQATP